MGRKLGVLLGALLVSNSPLLAAQKFDPCPLQTPDQWQKFLRYYANEDEWVQTCEDSTCNTGFYSYVEKNIQAVFSKCQRVLDGTPQLNRCTSNMRRFVVSWMRQHDSVGYGFLVDNHHYLQDQESPSRPANMMKPPASIIAALPSLKAVAQAARRGGWRYLTHDSALGGSRTFVLVSDPEGKFDQWMLLNLKDGSNLEDNTPFSMLVIQKKDRRGRKLSHVRLHFRDYSLHRDQGRYKLVLNETSNGKCYACHVSGVRQLIPRRTPILEALPVRGEQGYGEGNVPDDFAFKRLVQFNERLRSYGIPDWEGKIAPEDHGPLLGQAQGCVDCHNDRTRGGITVITSRQQLARKLDIELSMPTDTDLPSLLERHEMHHPSLSAEEERKLQITFAKYHQLVKDIEASKHSALKNWFLEVPCSGEALAR